MKFYLSASFDRQAEMRGYAEQLRTLGHEVTSTWIDAEKDLTLEEDTSSALEKAAVTNFQEIKNSDILIAFTEDDNAPSSRKRGNRHVEFGIACGAGIGAHIIGPVELLMHAPFAWKPLNHSTTWAEFLDKFTEERDAT